MKIFNLHRFLIDRYKLLAERFYQANRKLARKRALWGTVLAENIHMVALGKKLGFTVKQGEDPSEYKLTIDLKTAKL